jgi:flavodoxin I
MDLKCYTKQTNQSELKRKKISKMTKTGIFYGTSSGNTLIIAKLIANEFAPYAHVHNVEHSKPKDLEPYELLIFGIPTWGFGNMQYDWEKFISNIKQLDLTNKKTALFGLGDQVNYPNTFLDGLGLLYEALKDRTNIIGFWPPEHYSFVRSRAMVNGLLAGLAIDQDNEESMSVMRISRWCAQLKNELR